MEDDITHNATRRLKGLRLLYNYAFLEAAAYRQGQQILTTHLKDHKTIGKQNNKKLSRLYVRYAPKML